MKYHNKKGKLSKPTGGIVVLSGRPRQRARGLPWKLRRLFREDAPRHNFAENHYNGISVNLVSTHVDGNKVAFIYEIMNKSDA